MQDASTTPAPPRRLRRPAAELQAVLLLVALTLLGLGASLRDADVSPIFEIDLATTTPGAGQVFVMVDGAYSEQASRGLELTGDAARQRHSLELPGGELPVRIRVDPGAGPGRIVLYRLEVGDGTTSRILEGNALVDAVSLSHQLHRSGDRPDVLEMQATGDDPYFEFAPPTLPPPGGYAKLVGSLLLLLAGTSLAAWLLWQQAPRMRAWMGTVVREKFVTFALLAGCGMLLLFAALGTGCEPVGCSLRGLRHGSALFIAVAGFAVVGTACFRLLGLGAGATAAPGFFAAALAGQVALVTYVYLRSTLQAAAGVVPLSGFELVVTVLACAAWLLRERHRAGPDVQPATLPGWFLVKLGLLAATCLIVADRELPRLVMLSSDPDTHAFLARQLERMGGIYRDQGDWGEDPLGYPAGTASLVFTWSALSWLGVGNALAAIPLMVTLVASFAIGEAVVSRTPGLPTRTLGLLTAAGVTAAGLLFPVYTRFAHMEGAGRQMSIGAVALLAICALATWRSEGTQRRRAERWCAAVAVPTLFLLAALNPVNVLVPGLLVAAWAAFVMFTERRLTWWLVVPLACPLLLLMDPYYFGILTGRSLPQGVILVGDYVRMTPADIGSAWLAGLSMHPRTWLQPWLELLPGHEAPTFAILAAGLALAFVATGRTPRRPAALAGLAVLVCAGTYVTGVLMQSVARDARLYLLPQYFPVSLAQYKAVLLIGMAASLPVAFRLNGRRFGAACMAAAIIVALFALTVRPVQPMHLAPRHDYCGSMGCARPSDLDVIRQLEAMVEAGELPRVDGRLPRVLVPNALVSAGDERWVFPTGASRYLALADALPVAFYYYQGDSDFTTENYRRHVCDRLDRAWLARERISYVFLPADREGTCLAGLDALRSTDTVVLASGDSLLIRLDAGASHSSPPTDAPEAPQGQ